MGQRGRPQTVRSLSPGHGSVKGKAGAPASTGVNTHSTVEEGIVAMSQDG